MHWLPVVDHIQVGSCNVQSLEHVHSELPVRQIHRMCLQPNFMFVGHRTHVALLTQLFTSTDFPRCAFHFEHHLSGMLPHIFLIIDSLSKLHIKT